jgi:hypothetical protein
VFFHREGESRVARVADGELLPFRIDLASIHWQGNGRGRWMPDGRRVAFLGGVPDGSAYGVFVQDFSPQAADTSASRRPFAGFDPEHGTDSFGISPDGSRAALSELDERSDIFVASGVPDVRP